MSFLAKIRPTKEAEVQALRAAHARAQFVRAADQPVRDFTASLLGPDRLIAEIKRKSPSHPEFHQPASPATLARAYRRHGAAAISLVTDAAHFGTSLADVAAVKEAVSLPVLVKDFVFDEVQITAAWAGGADAVLLIVRMVDGARLHALLRHARSLGLHVLVECHDKADIALAVAAEAPIIGVNNRDLATLTTDLNHGARLMPHVPRQAIRVSESGLYRRADIEHMAGCGANAFLVGHALLQSRDPGRRLAELVGREAESKLRVKTCGITNVADAEMADRAGASCLGLIFAPGPRQVSCEQAIEIRLALPDARMCGVFVDENITRVKDLAETCDLDLIQLHGHESPAYCQALAAACGLPLIKALSAADATPERAAAYNDAAYILVDLPKSPDQRGLTTADCRAAARKLTLAGHDVFLAGGLTTANVRQSDRCPLFAVDVASGIEYRPGVKNPVQTREFITEATR